MAGVAGQNIDKQGYPLDPELDVVIQNYKESGIHPLLVDKVRRSVGGFRTVKIPTASVLTLNTVPVQIVPAPGSGLLVVPTMMIASMVYGSATYSCNSSGITLKYGTAGAGTSTLFTISQAFLQASSGTNVQVINQASAATYLPATTDYNVPLTLIAASSDPATGDSDLYVRVYYRVVAVPFAV